MKASEAHALTSQYVNSADVDVLYRKLCERIRATAQQGKTSIAHPFSGLDGSRVGMPTREQQDALRQKLVADGYSVDDHPDPDPGHPCSGAYTTVSW